MSGVLEIVLAVAMIVFTLSAAFCFLGMGIDIWRDL